MRLPKLLALSFCAAALSIAAGINMPAGKVELKSAGALAIGPNGILFVGVHFENLVEPHDMQHVLNALSGPQQLQAAAKIARACKARDEFADSCRAVHVRNISEVQDDFALARFQ